MAPLAPNNTSRVFVDYTDGINPHTLECRFSEINSSPANAMFAVGNFLTALGTDIDLLVILGARVQHQTSLVSSPVTWNGAANYGTGTMPGSRAPLQTMFQGRSALGRRWKLSIFGYKGGPADNFRLASSIATIGAAITAINAAHAGSNFQAIDGGTPVLQLYASQNYNNHFETVQHGR